jgi:hypothetical protein
MNSQLYVNGQPFHLAETMVYREADGSLSFNFQAGDCESRPAALSGRACLRPRALTSPILKRTDTGQDLSDLAQELFEQRVKPIAKRTHISTHERMNKYTDCNNLKPALQNITAGGKHDGIR